MTSSSGFQGLSGTSSSRELECVRKILYHYIEILHHNVPGSKLQEAAETVNSTPHNFKPQWLGGVQGLGFCARSRECSDVRRILTEAPCAEGEGSDECEESLEDRTLNPKPAIPNPEPYILNPEPMWKVSVSSARKGLSALGSL